MLIKNTDYSYENAIEVGAFDFITKPVSIKELQMRLNRVITHRYPLEENKKIIEDQQGTLIKYKDALAELRQIIGGIIDVLASVIEVRDPYTAGHQKRVADLARSIADHMGLDKQTIQGIRVAGTIHDIGKISI